MKSLALGFLVLLGTLLLGLAIGVGVYFALAARGADVDFAQSIGLGVWWMTAIVLFAYANVWLDPFHRLRGGEAESPGSAAATRQRHERVKAQTAAIRGAALFAMIGGLMVRSQSAVVILAVAVGCGVLGWLFGADYKRRVNRSLNRGDQSAGARSSHGGPSGQRPREAARKG